MSKFKTKSEDVDLNLIPIMNLFTALIPFLLMSAVFYKLSVLNVSIPLESSEGVPSSEKDLETLTLKVELKKNEIILTPSNHDIDPKKLKPLQKTISKKLGVDKDALKAAKNHALSLKEKYPKSERAVVVPEKDLPFLEVVAFIDILYGIPKDHKLFNTIEENPKNFLFNGVVLGDKNE